MDRSWHDKWKRQIEFLEEYGKHLNQWEIGFIASLSRWLSEDKDLTMKQSFKLGKIFHRIQEKVG